MTGWMKKLCLPCAIAGGICLAATALAAMGLGRGGWLDHAAVALSMLVLAGLALFLLKFEGYGWDVVLTMLLPIGVAMLVRVLCLDHASGDYNRFLCHWAEYFRENGGFGAVAHAVGDYNVPYLYFMAFISYIPVPDIYLIKLFSLVFDVLLAWGCLRLTRCLRGKGGRDAAPLIAFAAALLLPTVVLNGAYWGQCDAIYGAFVVHAVTMVLEGKNKTSVALMGLAFAFKLQAIFVLPLWGVLWLAKKVKFRELWVFPLTYLVVIIPAVLLGKPLSETLLVYFNQMGEYSRLTLNAPSIFQLFPYDMTIATDGGSPLLTGLSMMGVAAAGIFVLLLLWLGFHLRQRLDRETAFVIAVAMSIGIPFLLPHMHERYFFLADVLTLCWACSNVRRIPAAALVQASSAASYRVFLRLKFNWWFEVAGHRYVMIPEMLLMMAALALSIQALYRRVRAADDLAYVQRALEPIREETETDRLTQRRWEERCARVRKQKLHEKAQARRAHRRQQPDETAGE